MKDLGFGPSARRRPPLARGGARLFAAAALLPVLALVFGAALAQQAPDGAGVYEANCVSCHGASGGGGIGPALAGNEALADAAAVVRQILQGGAGMPAFAGPLSDAQIAAVATYIRTSWGNDFGAVEPSLVGELREGGGAAAGDGTPAEDPAEQDAPPEQDEQEQPGAQAEQTEEQQPADAQQEDDDPEQDEAQQPDAQAEQAEEQQPADSEQEDGAQAPDDAEQQEDAEDVGAEEQPGDSAQPDEAGQPQQPPDEEELPGEQQPPAGPQPDASAVFAPAPDGTAALELRVEPESASVEVVGPTGFDPVSRQGGEVLLEDIPAGPYRITVTLEGESFVQLVDLTRGGRAEVVFELGGGGG